MSTSTFWRDEPPGGDEDEHRDEERRDRIAFRMAGPRREEAEEDGGRAGQVAGEVERARAEGGARVLRAARCETVGPARVDDDDDAR